MSKAVCKNDDFIRALIADSNYLVFASGEIQCRINLGGHVCDTWRVCGTSERHGGNTMYRYIRYKGKRLTAHRIVYQKFIGELTPDLFINHIDGDGLNNSVENLELVTHSQNMAHNFRVLGHKPIIGNFKVSEAKAKQIREMAAKGIPYSAICAKYGISKSTVSYIVNGKTWKAG